MYDDVSRREFNAAMSQHDSDRKAWEAERTAIEGDIAALKRPKKATSQGDAYFAAEHARLRAEVSEGALDAAKRMAYEKFPLVTLVPDLLVGDTPEEIMLSATAISQRLGGFDYSEIGQAIMGLDMASETALDATG